MPASVLVADDDAAFRVLATRVLVPVGLTVAREAETAAAVEHEPDGEVRRSWARAFVPKDELPNAQLSRLLSADRGSDRALRVVIGEDDVLLREGICRLLAEAGFEVAAQAGDAETFLRRALAHQPDVAVVDIQMPPGRTDDGLRAAVELRRQRPETGVLVLSHFCDEHFALDLIGDRPEGVGYLLKERVGDVDAFIDAVARVAAGGSALDPEVVARMLGRRRPAGPLDRLSPRERDVLAAMAEGNSNHGIAQALVVSEAAVEKHVTSIFHKLELDPTSTGHRRVLAVLAFLHGAHA